MAVLLCYRGDSSLSLSSPRSFLASFRPLSRRIFYLLLVEKVGPELPLGGIVHRGPKTSTWIRQRQLLVRVRVVT
jgi:hypothetical protein